MLSMSRGSNQPRNGEGFFKSLVGDEWAMVPFNAKPDALSHSLMPSVILGNTAITNLVLLSPLSPSWILAFFTCYSVILDN